METLEDLIAEFEEKYKQDTSGEKVSGYLLAPGGLEKPWDNHVKIALPSDIVPFIRHVYASALEWGAERIKEKEERPCCSSCEEEKHMGLSSLDACCCGHCDPWKDCRSILLSESKRINPTEEDKKIIKGAMK